MRYVRLILLTALAVATPLAAGSCDRAANTGDVAVADTLSIVEDSTAVLSLLSPIRAMGIAVIEYGQLAEQRAASPAVREYAGTVAADQRALVGTLDSVARQRHTVLTVTPEAQELENIVRMAHSGLDQLDGAQLDLPFTRAEVESHRQMLDRLDQHIIPAATSTEMKTLLVDVRAMTDAHLARARQLLAEQLGEQAVPAPAVTASAQPQRATSSQGTTAPREPVSREPARRETPPKKRTPLGTPTGN